MVAPRLCTVTCSTLARPVCFIAAAPLRLRASHFGEPSFKTSLLFLRSTVLPAALILSTSRLPVSSTGLAPRRSPLSLLANYTPSWHFDLSGTAQSRIRGISNCIFTSLSCTLRQQSVDSPNFRRSAVGASSARDMPPPLHVMETVVLDDKEKELFDILKATLQFHQLNTVLRVAGGWVRDKLLGRASGDIDIALDDMMGSQFAQQVNEYLTKQGEQTTGIGVIKSNPDQSKHLETATLKVHGQSIDFVNLRSETYADDSRIPTMEFGTAEEDAYRRDLTINSLFYNINSGEVEDLTGKGLPDLKAGIIRTPLPARSTFLDDPLRVLRAVRFGARFGFDMDHELVEAAQGEEVRLALGSKISRERIGVEVDLMLSGRSPLEAMRQLLRLNLFSTVFALPSSTEPSMPVDYGRACIESLAAASAVLKAREALSSAEEPCAPAFEPRVYFLAALLLPLRKVTYADAKGKPQAATSAVIKEALKLKSKDADQVALIHTGAEEFVDVARVLRDEPMAEDRAADKVDTSSPTARRRIVTGLLVRRLKDLWQPALGLSTVLSAASFDLSVADNSACDADGGVSHDEEEDKKRAESWIEIEKLIVELGLQRAWETKPLLDGKEVMSALGLTGGGPILGYLMGQATEWQLAYQDGTAEECKAWLKTLPLPQELLVFQTKGKRKK